MYSYHSIGLATTLNANYELNAHRHFLTGQISRWTFGVCHFFKVFNELAPQSAFNNTPKIFFKNRSIQLEKQSFANANQYYTLDQSLDF